MKSIFCILALAGVAGAAHAQFSLADGNATASVDPTSANFPFLRGLNSLTVDGVEQAFQGWYWFRLGNSAEQTIDTLSAPTVTGLTANSANVRYSDSRIAIDITYTLVGGANGSGSADLSQVVRVSNLTNGAIDFHLFEYDDFDIGGSPTGDTATLLNSSTIAQSDGLSSVTMGATGIPNHYEIAALPNIYSSLTDSTATTLGDTGSGTGPGDLAFAFQWDRSIAGHGSFLMSKNGVFETVPEPATMVALSLGVAAALRRRKR